MFHRVSRVVHRKGFTISFKHGNMSRTWFQKNNAVVVLKSSILGRHFPHLIFSAN